MNNIRLIVYGVRSIGDINPFAMYITQEERDKAVQYLNEWPTIVEAIDVPIYSKFIQP